MISITCLSVVSAYKQRGPTNRLQERLKDPSKNRKPSENGTNDRRFWGKYMEVYGLALTPVQNGHHDILYLQTKGSLEICM
jgi:polyphosphate kinase 2 (PPK2 family)